MNQLKNSFAQSLPVFLSFIVMGFVDIVGVSTGYVKQDFGLSDSLAQFLPSMVFIWFFLLSVPTGIFQDKYGKRNVLNIGMALTGAGMLIPFINYSFPMMLVAFILLGIGNTIVQVSANPLLLDVVPANKEASYLSLSQFIKAICSLLGPVITTAMATTFGNWKLVFIVFAVTSFLSVLWLALTPINESKPQREPATFSSCFSLLKNRHMLIMTIAIFMLVGADVGMNSNIANLLTQGHGLSLEEASLGITIYFTALMIGRFSGAVLLNWLPAGKFFIGTSLVALASLVVMILAPDPLIARIAIFFVGLGSANLFALIFSAAVRKMPDRTNEISGLLIMAVAGGAFIPPLMGAVNTASGVVASFLVIVAAMVYLLGVGVYAYREEKK